MSFNLSCYKNIIKETIENYLIYNQDDSKEYDVVIKRAVYLDLIKNNISFIHEIKQEINKLGLVNNPMTATDGSKGQWDYSKKVSTEILKELIKELMSIKRIKDCEVEK